MWMYDREQKKTIHIQRSKGETIEDSRCDYYLSLIMETTSDFPFVFVCVCLRKTEYTGCTYASRVNRFEGGGGGEERSRRRHCEGLLVILRQARGIKDGRGGGVEG